MSSKNTIMLTILVILLSCTKSANTPEGLLKMYVNDITSSKVDKDYYLKYTTGRLKESISSMSDEEIESLSKASKLSKVRVEIVKSLCQEVKCSITYIISYKSETSDSVTFSTEVKKIAQLVKEEEQWKIESVVNSKTYHESEKAIDITN